MKTTVSIWDGDFGKSRCANIWKILTPYKLIKWQKLLDEITAEEPQWETLYVQTTGIPVLLIFKRSDL